MGERRAGSRVGGLAPGQAQIELIAAVPFVLFAVLAVIQLFGVLYAQSVMDGAAEAGALALADGRKAEAAVRAAVPGWGRDDLRVDIEQGRVRIEASPPAVVPWLGSKLTVDADAYARPAG